jgi:hypothetical protein
MARAMLDYQPGGEIEKEEDDICGKTIPKKRMQ